MEKAELSLDKKIESFIDSHFSNIVGIFGYGSGVIKQSGYSEKSKKQIDSVIVINDDEISVADWHKNNMKKNPKLYGLLARTVMNVFPEKFQNWLNRIYYFTNVKHNGDEYKVGVITKSALLRDLKERDAYYVAARFQKPIRTIRSTEEIDIAIEVNRKNVAIETVLREQKKKRFQNPEDFFIKLSRLSYIGDIRVLIPIFENPNKVKNMVSKNINNFKEIYSPMRDLVSFNDNKIAFDRSYIRDKIAELPDDIKRKINRSVERKLNQEFILDNIKNFRFGRTKEEYILEKFPKSTVKKNSKFSIIDNLNSLDAPTKERFDNTIRRSISRHYGVKNFNISTAQLAKGLVTAGPVKSIKYVLRKAGKGIKGIFESKTKTKSKIKTKEK